MALIGLGVPIALAQSVSGSGDVSPAVPSPPTPAWDAGPVLSIGIDDVGSIAVENGGQLVSSIHAPGFVGTYIGRNVDGVGTVVVSGADASGKASIWENAGFLSVGYSGDGSVRVEDGGQMTSLWSRIGTNAGSTGSVTVAGTDAAGNASRWETGPIMVGRAGAGVLTIEEGGQVAVGGSWSLLGWQPGSSGTMSVSGAGSSFIGTETFRVGYHGTGALEITDGGLMETGETKIGFRTGSTGSAVVSGVDALGNAARWENTQALVVGSQGTGTLTISDGGQVTSAEGYIGESGRGNGTVEIVGSDFGVSRWTNAGLMSIGHRGTGSLSIEDGGSVISGESYLALGEGSTGVVTVSGRGANGAFSRWQADKLTVGHLGEGTLRIADSGWVSSGSGVIGREAGSHGEVTLAGGYWDVDGQLRVGVSGTGTLDIANGQVTSADAYIGRWGDGDGTVTMSGSSASWRNEGVLTVGSYGSGTLSINDGSKVTTSSIVMGERYGAEALISISGTNGTRSTLDILGTSTDDFDIRRGTVIVENGALLRSPLAWISSSSADFTISGTDAAGNPSEWQTPSLYILYSDSKVTIEDGARMSSTNSVIAGSPWNAEVHVSGTDVNGNPSTWAIEKTLGIGRGANIYGLGDATLSITGGGHVTTPMDADVSSQQGTGTVAVTGIDDFGNPSLFHVGGKITIGTAVSTGAMYIKDGGRVETTDATIGYQNADTLRPSRVEISGADANGNASHWENGDQLDIVRAIVSLEDGGTGYSPRTSVSYSGLLMVSGTADDGSASIWETEALLLDWNSRLIVRDGGQLDSATANIRNGSVLISGTSAHGTPATWTTSGFDSYSDFTVEGGGLMITRSPSTVRGTVTVSGSGDGTRSTWDSRAPVEIADGGALIIENGGKVSNTWGELRGGANGQFSLVSVSGVDADGNPSLWQSSGGIRIGNGARGALTIAGDGVVLVGSEGDPGRVILANGASSAGTINIGAAANAAARWPGELKASEVNFGTGVGTVVFNHTSSDYVFAPEVTNKVSGTHKIDQLAGVTKLTADSSSFAGLTTVSGGTLVVANALGGTASVNGGRLQVDGTFLGDVTVRSGGILSGTGEIDGDAMFNGSGALAGVQGRTLAVAGDATLISTSRVNAVLGGAVPAPALFDIGGNLTLDGTLNVTDQGGFGLGVYRLFEYGGTLTDNGLAIGAVPAGIDPADLSVQTAVAHEVNLVSSAGATLSFWDGGNPAFYDNGVVNGGAGTWRLDERSWTSVDGAVNGPFSVPGFAVFQGAPGTVSVDDADGAVAVAGLQFATDGYRVEGDVLALAGAGGESVIRVGDGTAAGGSMIATIAAELTGSSRLVKTDHGTLVLEGANSYTGGTRIDAGVLSVSADAALGAASGGLVLNGGTLATTADILTTRAVTFEGAGNLDVAAGTTLELRGALGGRDLRKAGDGTLVLAGASSYRNTEVEAGTLIGNADTIRGSLSNAGTVVFDQSADGSFAGAIRGLDVAAGMMVKRGTGSLALTGTSELDWTLEAGDLRIGPATFSGNVAIGSNATLMVDQSASVGINVGRISGTGALLKTGYPTFVYNGDGSGFTGLTTIHRGGFVVGRDELHADATLGGSYVIQYGGALWGYGTVGSGEGSTIVVEPGGTLGTTGLPKRLDLTINADVIMQGGSVMAVGGAPAKSQDAAVQVTGSATIESGATLLVEASDVAPRGSYTLLAAEGGLSGRFDEVQADFAFLDTEVAYDYAAGTVALEVARNELDFASAAATGTQAATAAAVESLGLAAENPLYDAVALLPNDLSTIRSGLDQLSGEIHASAQSVLMQNSHFLRDAVAGRLRAAFGGVAAPTSPVMAYEGGAVKALPADTERGAFWAYGFGSWGGFAGTDNAASVNNDVGGVFMGADAPMLESWRLGVMAGYSSASFEIDDRSSSGDGTDWHVGLYGGTQQGPVGVRLGLAYTWSEIETARAVAIPGFSDQLKGDYDAGTFQAFGDVGYRIDLGVASFEPFAGLAYVSVDTDGFTEQGGAAALSAAGQDMETTFTTLGLRASTALSLDSGDVVLSGALGWRHAFGDVVAASTLAFAGSENFTVAGVPIAEDAAVVEAGLAVSLSEAATLGLAYQGQFGGGVTQNGFNAALSVKF
ncbi:outer membrane autotransporter protein [Ancylobacter sp. 3268]|nr:outer membrane autotransporter protein [Ancylobacter sp. 3268]